MATKESNRVGTPSSAARVGMTKTAKLTWLLLGGLLLALLAAILVSRGQGRGGFNDYIDEVAYFVRNGRRRPKLSPCIDNLRRIEMAKINWAHEQGETTNDTPSWSDLRDHLMDVGIKNGLPVCPEGGNYKINRVGERPTCSKPGGYHGNWN